ncbi:MAG: sigma-70 family RNA polymerase sigma factor [Candidatus Aminicenantes bacterium]|nr:sigma-70 family RNA polymerase sigma factor [Candidatus Aminicenantes bacterium]
MDDNRLLKGCMEGDLECYQQLVHRYSGKAMALALNILKNKQDAEDACQDAFIRIFNNLEGFDFNKKFKDWFYAILYNRCIDLVRKKHRFYQFFLKKKAQQMSEHKQKNKTGEIPKPLPSQYLKKLSPKEKTALLLWAQEGYESKEIGEIMKCSPSTVRVYLFKARQKIKSYLEKKNEPLQNH